MQPIRHDSTAAEPGRSHLVIPSAFVLSNVCSQQSLPYFTLTYSNYSYAIINVMLVMVTFPCKLNFPAYRHSIHSHGDKGGLKAAVDRYPEPVKGAEGVYYCGYNSEKSYGGSAWLVVRKEGNIMVDSPRFDPKLLKRIKVINSLGAQLSAVTVMLLTSSFLNSAVGPLSMPAVGPLSMPAYTNGGS